MTPLGLFFDMDGTLIDSEPVHYRAYAAMLAEYGHSFDEQMFASFVGKSTLTNVRWLKQRYCLSGDEQVHVAKKQAYFSQFLSSVVVFPDVISLLEKAAAQYPLTVVTSTKKRFAQPLLELTELLPFFSYIVTGDEGLPKPSSSLYTVALHKNSFSPNDAVAFEDSLSGYQAAYDAGISCVVIPNRYTRESITGAHTAFSLEEALRPYL